MNKINILLIGTDEFATYQFKKIIKNKSLKIKNIITKKNDKNIEKIKKKKITIYNTKNINELNKLYKKIKKTNIDLTIVISYGLIIPKEIIEIPKLGTYNIHPSLLPKWRGPSPIQHCLLNGEKETGISIIKINNKIDSGNIIYQKKIKIKKKDNYITLINKLKKISSKILPKIINKIKNKKIKEKKQKNNKNNKYAKKIKKIDGLINWNNNAKFIIQQIKSYYKWPKTFFLYKKNIIFIWKAYISSNIKNKNHKIGEIIKYNKKYLKIQTKNKILKITRIQINGRKKLNIIDFYNSKPIFFKKGNLIK